MEDIRNFTNLMAAGGETSVRSSVAQFAATLVLSAFTYIIFKLKAEILKRLKPGLPGRSQAERKHTFSRYKLWGKIICLLVVLLPTLTFVLVMRDTYTPAVFTMALLAIIVAVDHDTELEETPEEIVEEVSQKVAERLGQLQGKFESSIADAKVKLSEAIDKTTSQITAAVSAQVDQRLSNLESKLTISINDVQTKLSETIGKTPAEIMERVSVQLESKLAGLEQAIDETLNEKTTEYLKKVETLMQLSESHTWAAAVIEELSDSALFSLNRAKRFRSRCVVKHWEIPEEILVGKRAATNFEFYIGNTATNSRKVNLNIDYILADSESMLKDPTYRAFELSLENSLKDQEYGHKSYLRFISPAPLRVQRQSYGPTEIGQNGLDTRYFFGLIYTMCCLYKSVNKCRDGNDKKVHPNLHQIRPARIRVGPCSNWVHVINDKVFQMLETSIPSRALSRPLHQDLDRFGTSEDRAEGAVREWADGYADIVQNAYDRGSRAERYIASVLLSCEGERVDGLDKSTWLETGDSTRESRFSFTGSIEAINPGDLEKFGHCISRLLGGSDQDFQKCILLDLLNTKDPIFVEEAFTNSGFIEHANHVMGAMIIQYLVLRLRFLERGIPDTWAGLKDFLIEESVF
jgi:hypothetical protein